MRPKTGRLADREDMTGEVGKGKKEGTGDETTSCLLKERRWKEPPTMD